MSYHEDRYIEYLGEQDGKLGGDGWRDDFNPRVSLEKHLRGETMPLAWKPQSNETHKQWLDAIEEVSEELNTWETNFILDISIRVYKGLSLSEKQEAVLERIYAGKTK